MEEKLRTILVDDEPNNNKVLQYELERHCKEVEVIEICTSAKEAIKVIVNKKPDLVFLDINMPYISGLEMLEMFQEPDFEVIFVTAHQDYAVQAFKTCAIDYLLKPVNKDDLKTAVSAVMKNRNKEKELRYKFLANQVEAFKRNTVEKVMVPTNKGYSFVYIKEIIYCESDDTYSYIHLADGEQIFVMKPLKFLDEMLSEFDFERVHRSFLINYNRIKTFVKGENGGLVMENGRSIPISKSKKNDFMKRINNSQLKS